jgi:hypothetical protein
MIAVASQAMTAVATANEIHFKDEQDDGHDV